MAHDERLDAAGDTELLRRSSRSAQAFRILYDRHVGRLHAFLLRRTNDATAAFELTAETFAQAWLSRDRFVDRGEGVAPWLFGIAGNVLKTSIRQRSIETHARHRVGLHVATDVAAPRSEWMLGFDEDLAAAVADLPETQRRAVELRFIDDRDYTDVAGLLAISPGTARVRVHRGLAALRAAIATPKGTIR